MKTKEDAGFPPWRQRMHEIIFEADTPEGKAFDVLLIIAILVSVVAVMLESISGVRVQFGLALRILEWVFTLLFSVEYLLRIVSLRRPTGYIFSFYGIVDFMSTIPTYLGLLFEGGHIFIVIRILRLLRLFRVFKLIRYTDEANLLFRAVKNAQRKMIVFLLTVMSIVVIIGSSIYVIEGPENGFMSIPHGMYWAIVTITTVGYGDITPQTSLGKFFAALLMIIGYSILAIPTGIFSAEFVKAKDKVTTVACSSCSYEGHDQDASFCKRCGEML